MPGIATVLPGDDALARQRRIIRWHPLRTLNAMNVRVLGADLLTVRVQLQRDEDVVHQGGRVASREHHRRPPRHRVSSRWNCLSVHGSLRSARQIALTKRTYR